MVAEALPPGPTLRSLAQAAIADRLLIRPDAVDMPAAKLLVDQARESELNDGRWAERYHGPRAVADQPLAALAGALALSPAEQLTVALLAALEEDPLVGRAIAEAQAPIGGSRPTLGLLALAFEPVAGATPPLRALVGGAAVGSGLLTLGQEALPLAERTLGLPTPLYLALRGWDASWPGTTIGAPDPVAPSLPPSMLAEADRQARGLVDGARTLVIRTASTREGRAAASTLARVLGKRPLFIEGDATAGLAPWLVLRNLLPVFCYELAPGEQRRLPPLPYYDGPVLALAGPDGLVQASGLTAPDWVLGIPTRQEREMLWTAALDDAELGRQLAREQRHSAGRIAQLAAMTRRLLVLDGSERATPAHVQQAAWSDDGPGLTGLAIPLRDAISDDALITSRALKQELELLVLRCLARDGLSDELGASARARYRTGVRALFTGPSGTGKTLAAGWVATRLGMPLYRVDLAAVTSKYIGETEKNLAQLLARAEHAGVILLFDEADSMFGKRTEVKDANDRFANAQTNYLLQRIESFDGVTILTSNSHGRFDAAFSRRLDAIIDFQMPGPEERRALWCSHLGTAHRLAPRALNKLAVSVDLAGGHIRNVVFTAAVLARSQGRPIEYSDIVNGLTAELRKLGRQLPEQIRREDG